jgi:hypothetical protein
MGVSTSGNSHPHLHSPCPRCGYATRFKQFGPIRCLCSKTPEVRSDPQRSLANEHVDEIWAEQEQKNAALPIPSGPPLRIVDQYAAGRPRRR